MKPQHDAASSPIMTTAEVAQYLRISISTVYKLIRRRQIPAFKVASDYRFNKEAIEKWIAGKS